MAGQDFLAKAKVEV
jgi:hypothetical protein